MPSRKARFLAVEEEFTILGICWKCEHKTLGASTCAAFPRDIPETIILGEFNHRRPFPGDNGIQFEPVSDSTQPVVDFDTAAMSG